MKSKITSKTLQDLEFNIVLNKVAERCKTALGAELALKIIPQFHKTSLQNALQLTNEYLSSYENENQLPTSYFDAITKEISYLGIENSFLEIESFLKIVRLTKTTKELLIFLKKFKSYYPGLFELSEVIDLQADILKFIAEIMTPYGEILQNASPFLNSIRKEIQEVKGKISSSFNVALSKAGSANYLDEIKESVVDHQRVLAVKAMYRKKVKGLLLGTSKTGNTLFIAPEETLKLTRQLQNLEFDEQQEIIQILKALTNSIRPFAPDLKTYQNFLAKLDMISAKALYAKLIGGILPTMSDEKISNFKNAYHPLLLEHNNKQHLKTIPQSLILNQDQRIIVISGPNAGGKSITLKTIGLLQVMFQSGLLVPVHTSSSFHIFDSILTDIGDNQSIENHLSTYSYRLKNMRQFLQSSNDNTLLLIDEFGTGSDPELGGALAEVFLESFHELQAFGIITTHYTNLKVLADELQYTVNANMQFNERTLEPLYQLFIGQAGSSFTFEVASKNGIPFSLINRAKKKVDTGKVRLDKTISKLQKERNKLQKNSDSLEKEHLIIKEKGDLLATDQQKIHQKLVEFNTLYDNNQKMLIYGRKINELINNYFQTKNKKQLLANFFTWTATEQAKYIKKTTPEIKKVSKNEKLKALVEKKQIEEQLKVVEIEVLKEVAAVKKIEEKKSILKAKLKADYQYKINDRVRLIDSQTTGLIQKIEKNKVFINYGFFTTTAKVGQIELVEKA
ncbi:MAG: DNA mismatch repair protein MutS [Flavobacteriales bacterium CG11_big_fil_rev_8_21_14_0_20_35_7]|nr:MAG: DNA mismatch repair protein MutS [Flavobacteriales bacterium CG11_big_fil_rev_8_21_14_0_20_35_7]